jgi:glycosyltransferase involved in cell wall biosynthesis
VKIGIVTTSYPRFGGDRAGLFTAQLVESLKELDHQVLVVAPEAAGAQKQEGVFLARFGSRLSKKIAYGAGIVENLKKNPLLLLGIPGFIRGIARAVSEHLAGCEVIDASFTAAGAAVLKARRPEQAIVYTGHGTDIHLLDRSWLYRRYFKKLLAGYDAVTVVSRPLAKKLSEHGCGGEAVVIPNGVETGAFGSGGDWRDKPTVIFASRFIELKRPGLLLEAWAGVAGALTGAKLILFGDGPALSGARSLAARLELQKTVDFRGEVPPEQVWREMGRGWLTVLPSLREGFPPVLLESLAAGTPFLASPVGAAPEIAEKTGGGRTLPEPLTAGRLSEMIISALKDRDGLKKMGEAGREKILGLYSWESIARQKAALYSRAVSRKQSSDE